MDRTMNLDLGNLRSTKALLVLLLVYGILLPATFRIFQIDGLRSNATTSNDLANIVLNDVAPEVNETSALDIWVSRTLASKHPLVLVVSLDMAIDMVGITKDSCTAVEPSSTIKVEARSTVFVT